jgi:hypothetical protein
MTETWFLYAVAATVFAGINVFTAKVAAARNYNTKLFSALSSALAGILGVSIGFWVEGLAELSWAMLLIALFIGGIYILGSILRMDGLRYIDAMGVAEFVKLAEGLAEELGPLYAPTDKLRQMAQSNKRFYSGNQA